MPHRKKKPKTEIMGRRRGRSAMESSEKYNNMAKKQGEKMKGLVTHPNISKNNSDTEQELEGISNSLEGTDICSQEEIPMETPISDNIDGNLPDIDYAEQMTKDKDGFLVAYQAHRNNNVEFTFDDVIATRVAEQLEKIWESLYEFATECAIDMFPSEPANSEVVSTEEAEMTINGILLFGRLTLEDEKTTAQKERFTPPNGLIQTAVLLHSILPSISPQKDCVKNNISKLCELWHNRQLPDNDTLTTNTLSYLLQRSLGKTPPSASGSGPVKADIKRVHSMQSGILDYNITDNFARPFRELILEAAQTPLFYKTQEGVRFLAFLFTISPGFISQLHGSIKSIIPGASVQVAHAIGEVYFKAWRSCEGTFKTNIEEHCIQDLMQRAILANPNLPKNQKIFTPIRHILTILHHAKNDRQAQAMLSRLYEPILWRHLKVANSQARANAAQLFYDAFPVEDPNVHVEERSIQQRAQVQMMCELLKDESPEVRVISIAGASLLIAKYWLILSSTDLNDLVKIFVQDLVVDSSSSSVRAEVLKGFKHILNSCVRSHLYLKKILPKVRDSLQDVKESVRQAMVDLLSAVSKVKMIKYWDVCSIEHILARLEVEKSSTICTKIVDLLFNSFFPIKEDEDTKIKRCIYLIQQNQMASRKFFRYGPKFIPIHNQVKFMLAILVTLKRNIRQKYGLQLKHGCTAHSPSHGPKDMENHGGISSTFDSENTSDAESEADKENNQGSLDECFSYKRRKRKKLYIAPNKPGIMDSSPSVIPPQEYIQCSVGSRESSVDRSISLDSSVNMSLGLDNTTVLEDRNAENQGINEAYLVELEDVKMVGALLDVVCILWMARSTDIAKEENAEYRSLLEKKTSKLVSVLFKYYKASDVSRPLIYLCSFLPHSSMVTTAGYCLSQLRNAKNVQIDETEVQSTTPNDHLEKTFDTAWTGNQLQTFGQTNPLPTYIDALCNWNRGDDILELVTNWISRDLRQRQLHNRRPGGIGRGKGHTSRKGVRFSESAGLGTAKPELALQLMKYMLRHPVNREILLKKNRPQVEELKDTLRKFVDEFVHYLPTTNSFCFAIGQDGLVANQRFLCEVWDSLLKLTIMLHMPKMPETTVIRNNRDSVRRGIKQKEGHKITTLSNSNTTGQSENDVFIILEDLLEWAEQNLLILPHFIKDTFSLRLLNSLINACSNTITLHIADANFVGLSLEFAVKILNNIYNILGRSQTHASNRSYNLEDDVELLDKFDYDGVSSACLKPICR